MGAVALDRIVSASRIEFGNPFPMPFNKSVRIPIYITESKRLSVEIFNLLGQRVSMLYTGVLDSGNHDFDWDARDSHGGLVTSGIYFVVARHGTEATTKRLVYVR